MRGRGALIALMVAYVAALAVLATTGHFAFFPKEVVLPIVLVPPVISGRFRAFLEDWFVFICMIVLFDAVRGMVYASVSIAELPVYMGYAAAADEALLGAPISVLMQDAWLDEIGFFEKALVVVHASHFVVFLVFGMFLWYWRPDLFGRFKAALGLVLYVGLLIYLLVPTIPPWMAAGFGVIGEVRHVTAEVYNASIPEVARGFDLNPIAAMPSLHTAIPVLLATVALRAFRWRGIPVLIYALAVCLSITYLGEHYLIDVLAGIALALLMDWVAFRSPLRSWRPKALQPNPSSGLSALTQRLSLGAVLIVMTVLIGTARSSLAAGWQPNSDFARRELLHPSPRGPQYLAAALLSEGQHSEALVVLEGLREDEHNEQTLQLLTAAHLEAGNGQEAIEASSRFVRRAGESPDAIAWQTLILLEYDVIDARDVEQAIRYLEARFGDRSREAVSELRARLKDGS